jgi:hypothetical protein
LQDWRNRSPLKVFLLRIRLNDKDAHKNYIQRRDFFLAANFFTSLMPNVFQIQAGCRGQKHQLAGPVLQPAGRDWQRNPNPHRNQVKII